MKKYIPTKEKPIETLCLCRVSSDKQAKKETIMSQKQACLDYAKNNGFIIDKFFYEDGVSGWKTDRPGLDMMMEYITREQKNKRIRVLFFDMSRLSRNLEVFSRFENLVIKYDIELLTVVAGKSQNNATGRFVRGIDILNARRFSDELSEKTRASMRSLMTLGYYPLNPPLGLKRQKDEHNKVILVPDEPKATLIRQAFEKYASGELATKHAVADFLNSHDVWNGRRITDTAANDILHNVVYTGVFAYDKWEIPLQEWKMVKLIPMDLFDAVQTRLDKGGYKSYNSTIADDFPLRHEVFCEHCGHPLTGYYAKSGTRGCKHPYYRCHNKECVFHKKSIRRNLIEDALVEKLHTLKATDGFLDLCCDMITKIGKIKEAQTNNINNETKTKITNIKHDISQLTALVIGAMGKDDDELAKIYQEQIKELNANKQALEKQLENNTASNVSEKFRTAIENGREFFKRPDLLWSRGTLSQKRRLVRLIFTEKPVYHQESGFRTASTVQIFNENTVQTDGDSDLAALLGFEPGFSP